MYLPPVDALVLEGFDEFLGGDIDIDGTRAPEPSTSLEWAELDAHARCARLLPTLLLFVCNVCNLCTTDLCLLTRRHYGMQTTPLADPDAEDESWIPGEAARLVPLLLFRLYAASVK